MRGCTQEDAPALEVYLSERPFSGNGEPAEPYLRIEVGGADWNRLTGRSLELIPLSRRGVDPSKPVVRAELDLQRGSPIWLSGSLLLSRAELDRPVEGSYNLAAPDGQRWVGTFKATWVKTRGSGCG
jgi:hypothetical protein